VLSQRKKMTLIMSLYIVFIFLFGGKYGCVGSACLRLCATHGGLELGQLGGELLAVGDEVILALLRLLGRHHHVQLRGQPPTHTLS